MGNNPSIGHWSMSLTISYSSSEESPGTLRILCMRNQIPGGASSTDWLPAFQLGDAGGRLQARSFISMTTVNTAKYALG